MSETTPRSSGPRLAAQSALDVMLTDAAVDQGSVGRFVQPVASAKLAAKLALHPNRVVRRAGDLGRGLVAAAGGRSEVAPAKGDRRFADKAWQQNWLLRRLLQ